MTIKCKICHASFIRSGTSRVVCCSEQCKKRLAAQRKHRALEKLKRLGLCQTCNAPCAPFLKCELHRREGTINRHNERKYKRYYLGSKLSPDRSNWIIN